jgi:hypothetical protein
MLTEAQANRVWERMVEAEVRSLYFGDLANRYTRRKQIISGLSFFLSSGAAATIIAKAPDWVPVGLDRYISSMTKLHCGWNELASAYERLWNRWRADDAERIFEELIKRGMDLSELATEMPYREKLMDKWRDLVYSRFRPDVHSKQLSSLA